MSARLVKNQLTRRRPELISRQFFVSPDKLPDNSTQGNGSAAQERLAATIIGGTLGCWDMPILRRYLDHQSSVTVSQIGCSS